MAKIKLLWHEPSNMLAVYDDNDGMIPLLTILDAEWKDKINPFPCYPLSFLDFYGWEDLGELE